MKRIGNSKEPTPARMLAIASNLRDHLKCYVSLDITSNAFTHTSERGIEYGVYFDRTGHHHFKTWPEVISLYRKVMKEGLDSVS